MNLDFNAQILSVQALNSVPDKRDKKQKKVKTESILPGTESKVQNAQMLANLPDARQALFSVIRALMAYPEITVHDTVFTPQVYFEEQLIARMKSYV